MEDLQMGHATSSSPETPALSLVPLALTTSHEHSSPHLCFICYREWQGSGSGVKSWDSIKVRKVFQQGTQKRAWKGKVFRWISFSCYFPEYCQQDALYKWDAFIHLPHIYWISKMVGWHHQLNGHEFEQTPGDSEGQGSLACCSLWGCRVRHNWATEQQPL